MVRVAVCLPCQKEMLETEMLDHIEKLKHREDYKGETVQEYREWFKANFRIEDRTISPYDQPWLKNVRSLGIETRVRHE